MDTVIKDPDAELDYGFDWRGWLQPGEAIETSTWIIPSGLTKSRDSERHGVTVVWLSGGTAGTTYQITNRITTSKGRTDDRSISLEVAER